MSGRVAYLERSDRGLRPAALRLVGERSDETFRCSLAENSDDGGELARMADWIRERVPRSSGGPGLDLLCLDVEGSLCSWLSAPSAESGVVSALARHGASDGWGESEGTPGAGVLGAYAGSAADSSVQALAVAAKPVRRPRPAKGAPAPAREAARQRLAVLAVPDAAARVLLDALDERGVRVGSVCSLWQAMCLAWDPSAAARLRPASADENGRIVADSTGVHGTVLVDPRGRLLWAWSDHAGLLAGGSIRLRSITPAGDGPAGVQVTRADLARLATEWLAWSAQLGAAPVRVTCINPAAPAGEGALEAGEIGQTLGEAWPGALVDMAVDDDPLGATLRRLAALGSAAQDAGRLSPVSPEDPSASLVNLTHRPGRAHFRLYFWAALSLLVAAGGLGAAAVLTWMAAAETEDARAKTHEQWRAAFQDLKVPGQVFEGQELFALQKEVKRLEGQTGTVAAAEPAMPILEELETMSYVIGYPGVTLDEIVLDTRYTRPRIVVQVDSIDESEKLFSAIKSIAGSNIVSWSAPGYTRMANGKIKCTFSGSWPSTPPKPGGGGA